MAYLIGTDEAGYAPNLGPLVISSTVWRIDDDPAEPIAAARPRGRRKDAEGAVAACATLPADKRPVELDLYRRLRRVVCADPNPEPNQRKLSIADSKALYSPARGVGILERGVLALLALLVDEMPGDWRSAWHLLDRETAEQLDQLPWHAGYDSPLPHAADREDVLAAAERLRAGLAQAGVDLMRVRSTAVFPEPFNKQALHCGNKAEALSRWTLDLVAEALDACPAGEIHIFCDKHGGRNRYGRLLQQRFPEYLIEVHEESLAQSLYRWGPAERRIEIRFCAGGEAFLPVASASMVSKYLRELAMQAFNSFWCGRVENLRPTAGYPGDAARFKRDIAAVQQQLGIDDRVLWRDR